MKITIFLALALAAVYVVQAQPLFEEDAQGYTLNQKQDEGNTFQELIQLTRQKRANCSSLQCTAFCARRDKMGLCRKGNCKCY